MSGPGKEKEYRHPAVQQLRNYLGATRTRSDAAQTASLYLPLIDKVPMDIAAYVRSWFFEFESVRQ